MRCVTVFALLVAALLPQEPKWKSTDADRRRPNPYRRDANWAQLPAGLKWGAVIGADRGRTATFTSSTAASRILRGAPGAANPEFQRRR